MLSVLIVFLGMCADDTFQACYTAWLVAKRRFLAGNADAASDIGQLFSIGYGGAVVRLNGYGLVSAAVIVAIWAGSIAGPYIGGWLTDRCGPSTKQGVPTWPGSPPSK